MDLGELGRGAVGHLGDAKTLELGLQLVQLAEELRLGLASEFVGSDLGCKIMGSKAQEELKTETSKNEQTPRPNKRPQDNHKRRPTTIHTTRRDNFTERYLLIFVERI